jgi:hypothetical protein
LVELLCPRDEIFGDGLCVVQVIAAAAVERLPDIVPIELDP